MPHSCGMAPTQAYPIWGYTRSNNSRKPLYSFTSR
jgi:hypothetical protein